MTDRRVMRAHPPRRPHSRVRVCEQLAASALCHYRLVQIERLTHNKTLSLHRAVADGLPATRFAFLDQGQEPGSELDAITRLGHTPSPRQALRTEL